MCIEDDSSYEKQKLAALAAILSMGQVDIQAGRCRAVEEFFAELDAEDEQGSSVERRHD